MGMLFWGIRLYYWFWLLRGGYCRWVCFVVEEKVFLWVGVIVSWGVLGVGSVILLFIVVFVYRRFLF